MDDNSHKSDPDIDMDSDSSKSIDLNQLVEDEPPVVAEEEKKEPEPKITDKERNPDGR